MFSESSKREGDMGSRCLQKSRGEEVSLVKEFSVYGDDSRETIIFCEVGALAE